MQNSEQSALSLLFVVVDCQPPSKMVISLSETSAILLPCRRTTETPDSSLKCTVVLPLLQLTFAWIAAFIWVSILRMMRREEVERRGSFRFPLVCIVADLKGLPTGLLDFGYSSPTVTWHRFVFE